MKVKDMINIIQDKTKQNCECNFKLKSRGPKAPDWFVEYMDKIDKRFDRLENRLDNLEKRIDNLVVKNNLVE